MRFPFSHQYIRWGKGKPTRLKARVWRQMNEDSIQVLELIVMNEERDMILQRSTVHVVLLEGINFFPESE